MNERIQELAVKAGIYGAVDINGNYENEAEVKKFAELIIQKCFEAAMIESKGHMNPVDLMYAMKERVGVE